MQRERGELVPIGDALSGMGGPVKSIREATPQALHHFTLSDQVNHSLRKGAGQAAARLLRSATALRVTPPGSEGSWSKAATR